MSTAANTETVLDRDIERVSAAMQPVVAITVRVATYDGLVALRGVKSTDRVVETVERRMEGDLFVRRLVKDPNGQKAAGREGTWAWSAEEAVSRDATFESLGIMDGSREELVVKETPQKAQKAPDAPPGNMNLKYHPDLIFELGSEAPNEGLVRIKSVPGGDVPLYGMPYTALIGAIVSRILVAGDKMELEEGASETYRVELMDGNDHEAMEAQATGFFKSKKFMHIADEAFLQIRPA